MWSFEYTHPTTASPETIWRLWSDVSNWSRWDTDLEEVTLDGEFTEGAKGALRPEGMESFPFTITRTEPGAGYSDETPIGDAVLRFDHDLLTVEGERQVRQRVTMLGPSANELFDRFADKIIMDIPGSLARFAELAESEGRSEAA
jgi:Polyketide cyclase / dehydrase and lipid transport